MASEYDVAVVGMGVIGTPFATVLASVGHRVLGVDVDPQRVEKILTEKVITGEPDVDELTVEQLRTGRLDVSTVLAPAKNYIICVPTPLQVRAKRADLSYIRSAAQNVAALSRAGDLVVVESTVPPGTLRNVVAAIFAAAGKGDTLLAHAPDRLLPGDILRELTENDRIVGGLSLEATKAAAALYRTFAKGEVLETDADTAEMVKLFENTYRDVNVALANELSTIARNLGVDDRQAFTLANRHPRVNLLSPGIGVGGHCLPVDPWFLHEVDPESAVLVATARRVNDSVPRRLSAEIKKWLASTSCSELLLLGKSYKAGVWDPRESPALEIGQELEQVGITLRMWDPLESHVPTHPKVGTSTAVLLLVAHKEAVEFLYTCKEAGARARADTGRIALL